MEEMTTSGERRQEAGEREIDAALAREFGPPHSSAAWDAAIAPSSGFTAQVMERVREQAAAPLPLRFPWRRALPGICALALALAAGLVMLAGVGRMLAHALWAEAAAHPAAPHWAASVNGLGLNGLHLDGLAVALAAALLPLLLLRGFMRRGS